MTSVSSVVRLLQLEHTRLTKQIKGMTAASKPSARRTENGTTLEDLRGRARKDRGCSTSTVGKSSERSWRTNHIAQERTMSATARKRIAEAQKKRWAAGKAKKSAKS